MIVFCIFLTFCKTFPFSSLFVNPTTFSPHNFLSQVGRGEGSAFATFTVVHLNLSICCWIETHFGKECQNVTSQHDHPQINGPRTPKVLDTGRSPVSYTNPRWLTILRGLTFFQKNTWKFWQNLPNILQNLPDVTVNVSSFSCYSASPDNPTGYCHAWLFYSSDIRLTGKMIYIWSDRTTEASGLFK